MPLKTRRQLVPAGLRNQGSGTNTRRYLTIHQTDNWARGANAAAHANLQSRGYRAASWHWTVDDTEAVQSYPHAAVCWHAGDGGGGQGNQASIAIEFCLNADGNYQKTFNNATELAARILKEENIPLARMVQHNHWSGKNCPSQIRRDGDWTRFRNAVAKHLNEKPTPPPPTPKPGKVAVDGYWGPATTVALQKIMGTPQDGLVSSQPAVWKNRGAALTAGWEWVAAPAGSQLIRALQKQWGATVDGLIGPNTIKAMQKSLGGKQTGYLAGKNGSNGVKRLQKWVNERISK